MASQAEYQYADIRAKYQNFFRPASKILVDGQDLAEDLQCSIHSVSVSLCLGSPSTAEFELTDCYDLEAHRTKNQLISKLLPGSPVKISLGYGSSLSLLFCGYITCVELEFSEEAARLLRVRAADVCRMMQENGTRRRVHQVTKHSEAFTNVMRSYSGLCSSETEDTPLELTQGLFQEESDYDFVAKRLVRETGCGFEFLVEKGTAYFRLFDPDRAPVIGLSPGQGMKRLKLGLLFVKRDLEIQGYSPEQGILTARKTAEAGKLNSKSPKGTEILKAPWATSQDSANAVAGNYCNFLAGRTRPGTITVVGLPLLLPGNYISIADLDPAMDGKRYMTQVDHVLGEEGYDTTAYFEAQTEEE